MAFCLGHVEPSETVTTHHCVTLRDTPNRSDEMGANEKGLASLLYSPWRCTQKMQVV